MKRSGLKKRSIRSPFSASTATRKSPPPEQEKKTTTSRRVGLIGADATKQEMQALIDSLYD